jgi:hypothetical protein
MVRCVRRKHCFRMCLWISICFWVRHRPSSDWVEELTDRFSVYETYCSEHQLAHKTASEIAWIGSIQIFLQYVTSLVSGSLFDLHGAKVSSS